VESVTSGEVAKAKARWVDGSVGDDDAELVLETDGEDETVEIRTSLNQNATKKKMTIIFLHGFGDTAPQWEAFARTLVRGMEDSMDVVLPSAPKRYYATAKKDEEETTSSGESDDFSAKKTTKGSGGALFSGRAWFAPRLLPSRSDYESILAEYEDLLDENQAELEKRSFSCAGMKDSFERVKRLVEKEYPRDVILSGFSQGAAMAVSLMCSGEQKPKNLVGCLSFRGYLPRKPDEMKEGNETPTWTSEDNDKAVLMLAGESDPLVPVRWTKEAKVKAEALGLDVQAFFSEGYGHNVTSDDIYRARSWLRSRLV
jgi:predicted esterase